MLLMFHIQSVFLFLFQYRESKSKSKKSNPDTDHLNEHVSTTIYILRIYSSVHAHYLGIEQCFKVGLYILIYIHVLIVVFLNITFSIIPGIVILAKITSGSGHTFWLACCGPKLFAKVIRS